jgi:hypothetical protein
LTGRGGRRCCGDSCRRGIERRHGPSPRHAHAFLDTLVALCVTVDAAITFLRGAQAAFLLGGILLVIDADAFAVDHRRSPRRRWRFAATQSRNSRRRAATASTAQAALAKDHTMPTTLPHSQNSTNALQTEDEQTGRTASPESAVTSRSTSDSRRNNWAKADSRSNERAGRERLDRTLSQKKGTY